jgi:hypothetical protein
MVDSRAEQDRLAALHLVRPASAHDPLIHRAEELMVTHAIVDFWSLGWFLLLR